MSNSKGVDFGLVQAKRTVLEAIKIDQNGDTKDAYRRYLQNVQSIAHILLQDTQGSEFYVSANTLKCMQLATQCLERAEEIAREITPSVSNPSSSQNPTPVVVPSLPLSKHDSTQLDLEKSGDPAVGPVTQVDIHSLPEFKTIADSETDAGVRRRVTRPGPLEEARHQNQRLLALHQQRVRDMSSRNLPTVALSLTLQRKLAENLEIARAKQEEVNKRENERRAAVEKEAERRFAPSDGESEVNKRRRQLYTLVLTYEQDTNCMATWRDKVKVQPDDSRLLSELIRVTLSISDHPLTRVMSQQQTSIYNLLKPVLSQNSRDISHIKVPYEQPNLNLGNLPTLERGVIEELPQVPPCTNISEHRSDDQDTKKGANELRHCGHDIHVSLEQRMATLRGKPSENIESANYLPGSDFQHACRNTSSESSQFHRDFVNNCVEQTEGNGENSHCEQHCDDESRVGVGSCLINGHVCLSGSKSASPCNSMNTNECPHINVNAVDTDCSHVKDRLISCELKDSGGENYNICDSSNIPHTIECKAEVARLAGLHELLKTVTGMIKATLDDLVIMFHMVYDELDTAAGHAICRNCLEDPYFRPLWPYLITLYRLLNQSEEERLALVMTRHRDDAASQIGVSDALMPRDSELKGHVFAYHPAVAELRRVAMLVSPASKLELLVKVCRLICQCVDDYKGDAAVDKPTQVGADDLLPIMAYVTMRCELPQLVSECQVMEDFIHEGFLIGEEGYCLTSIQTALHILGQL